MDTPIDKNDYSIFVRILATGKTGKFWKFGHFAAPAMGVFKKMIDYSLPAGFASFRSDQKLRLGIMQIQQKMKKSKLSIDTK